MKLTNRLFLLILCAGFFVTQIKAQSSQASAIPGDQRVAKALNQTKTEYQVSSKGGDYTVTFGTKGKRTQRVFISSGTETINGVEMRLIFSFASITEQPPSQQIANLLLQDNMERIGVWAVQKLDDNRFAIVNKLYVPADFDGKKLDMALQAVVVSADEMEEKLTKKDEN